MNRHAPAIIIIVVIFIGVIASIILAARFAGSNATQESKTADQALLDLSENQQETINLPATPASNAQVQGAEFPGAAESSASESANPEAARKFDVILTNGKSFRIALYDDLAPKTVQNFVNKVNAKVYNDLLFFRIEKDKQGQTILVQTGDPLNNGQGGGVQPAEYNKRPFKPGSLGIARGQNRDKNSDSQFFITTQELPNLNEEYTNFGDVIEGLDVVQTIRQGQPILTIRHVN